MLGASVTIPVRRVKIAQASSCRDQAIFASARARLSAAATPGLAVGLASLTDRGGLPKTQRA